jgi:hypothetical protein
MIKITKKGNKAWVTFTIVPKDSEGISICGEWNDWLEEPMKVKKSGEFYITKILPLGRDYQFGYRTNENEWLSDNDLEIIASPFGTQNTLLKI